MVYADDILLGFSLAEILFYRVSMRICSIARYPGRLMTASHGEYTAGIYYAFDMSVQDVVREGMAFESLHHGTRSLVLGSSAAVDKPVYLYRREVLEPAQKFRDSPVLYRDDELIQIDKSDPAGVNAVFFNAVVIGGQLCPGKYVYSTVPAPM